MHFELTDIYGGIIAAGVLVNIWQTISAKRAAIRAAHKAQESAATTAARAGEVIKRVAVVAERVEEVHLATNGMKAALEEAAFARGKLEGKAEGTVA